MLIHEIDSMSEEGDDQFSVGDAVVVETDGDGARGKRGVVSAVWPSGRCTVTFHDGSFRSLPSNVLRRE